MISFAIDENHLTDRARKVAAAASAVNIGLAAVLDAIGAGERRSANTADAVVGQAAAV